MNYVYNFFFQALWIFFLLYWWLLSRRIKPVQRVEAWPSRAFRVACFAVAIFLFSFPQVRIPYLDLPILPRGLVTFWLGAAMLVLGIGFAVWARHHLGTNWSSTVTIKQNHELITSGPYGLVRHPIYTGLLLGFLGSAVATARVRGLVAFGLLLLAIWFKLRLEERWMREQFGPVYENYSRQVSALVPGLL